MEDIKLKKLLLVIDLQNDFINDNSRYVVEEIKKLVDSKKYDNIIFTKFINDYESNWYKKLNYKGCLTQEGQDIPINTYKHLVIEKKIYSSLNDELIEYINKNRIEEIHICGIDTECCVLKTALDLFEKNYNIKVLKEYCACTNGKEKHDNAINILTRCIGKSSII
ncbi:MAG: cysteine hydrolase [Clostridiales bacterium]|nr:cysteine hydrolase [Clostridiales bacterium]